MSHESGVVTAGPAAEAWTGASAREKALWLLESLVPGTAANNLSVTFAVAGRLDPSAVEAALAGVARRHKSLRTVYCVDDGQLAKRILDPASFRVTVAEVAAERPAEDRLSRFAAIPFELNGQPLIRVGVFRGDDGDTFCAVVHHLIFDVVSASNFLEELVAGYEHVTAGRQSPDGVGAEEAGTGPGIADEEPSPESLAFWRERLDGADPDVLALACASPEPARPTLAGAQITRELSPEAWQAAQKLQRTLRSPAAVILLAAYYVLLERHGAGPDLIAGLPVNIRSPATAGAIGYYVTFLPLRKRMNPEESVRDLVRSARDTFLAALEHRDVPVDALPPATLGIRTGWKSSLFRHVFNYVPGVELREFTIAGLRARTLVIENGCSKFDTEFFIMPSKESATLRIAYRTELLRESDVEFMLARYEAILLAFGDDPDRMVGELDMWSARDREVIEKANATTAALVPATVLEAIRQHARSAPDATAVAGDDRRVSYGELWSMACATRELLRSAGLGAGDVVGVALPRGAALVAAVLGTWLAGAAYMPIDMAHPAQRIGYQLSDSGTKAIVVSEETGDLSGHDAVQLVLRPGEDGETDGAGGEADALADPSGCAYLIYTSGSTGMPKGTRVTHRGLANVVAHFAGQLDIGAGDTALWTTTFSFDISALEAFVPLVRGGCVVAVSDSARIDGRLLGELALRHDARFLQATPTTWRLVIDKMGDSLRGRAALCGGEPVPAWLVGRLLETGCELHQVYGPTETTIWSTARRVSRAPGSRLDIGVPVRNTTVLILDWQGRELPVGIPGELCIAGAGVALGYHNRPELTAERFGEHPVHGRYYRTGDMARWLENGCLDLLGRTDRQVKIRGNRVELGEIEATLLTHPAVRAAAVLLRGDPSSDALLIAFIEPADGPVDVKAVREHARARLSQVMVPASFIALDALPVNTAGKVDYPALDRLAAERDDREREAAPAGLVPDGGLVESFIALWARLLERSDIKADTDFFASGGHSMLGAMVIQEVEKTTGASVSLAEFFEEPTPRGLASRVRAASRV